jgi:putative transposase
MVRLSLTIFAILNNMSRKLTFSIGEFYHVYNRGVDKRIIFENDSDYKRFALLLYLCNNTEPVQFDHLPNWRGLTSPELISAVFDKKHTKQLVDIGTYCLMPNHFHLLLHEISEKGISTFMQKLSTAYTMYFNAQRERTGSLFQGTFKAEHVDSDRYLKYLFSYINLNPVKIIDSDWKEKGVIDMKKVKKYLLTYPYSSYMDFVGIDRMFSKILKIKSFPPYFNTFKDFEKNVHEWLSSEGITSGEAKPHQK